jgi:hypothetical protein
MPSDRPRELPADPRASDFDEEVGRAALLARMFGVSEPAPRTGRFTLLERLGEGAMGVVWSAYDPQLDRRVAVKLLHPAADGDRDDARVLREARMMASINHPNVAQIYEVGAHEGRIFIAMEFVAGATLRAWQRQPDRDLFEVLAMYVQAGRGLAAAHRAGVVHRDFKPDNALVGADGRVRVVDFGLAYADASTLVTDGDDPSGGDRRALATSTRHRGGTPAYMAPEQFRGGAVDARVDQFAFCVALFEALCGDRPYVGRTSRELLEHAERGEVPLQRLPARVPNEVRSAIARGLRPDPTARHPSMEALLELLERDPRRTRRRAVLVLGLGTAVLTAAALGRSSAADADPCDASDRLVGVWDDARRTAGRAALEQAAPSFASSTWASVAAVVDGYADAWRAGHEDACEATHVRHEQSDALFDARMRCLDDRRTALSAVVQTLAEADATVAENASKAVASLPSVERCADAAYVQATRPPPEDPAAAEAVAAELQRIARARAMLVSGQLDAAKELSARVLERAQELQHPPLLARAEHAHGSALASRAEVDAAEPHLLAAWGLARRTGEGDVAGWAAANLAYLLARHTPRRDEARAWATVAAVDGELVGDARIQAAARNAFGVASILAEHREDAEAAFRDAIALSEGGTSPERLTYRSNLARYARAAGRIDESARMLEEVVRDAEELLGRDHPALIGYIDALGEAWIILGRAPEAEPLLERALALALAARGDAHPDTARILSMLGHAELRLDELEDARVHLERSIVVGEAARANGAKQSLGGLKWLAQVHFELDEPDLAIDALHRAVAETERAMGPENRDTAVSRGELATGLLRVGRHDDAMREIEHALQIFEKLLGPEHLDLSQGLQVRAEALAAAGREREAVADLERALSIRERALSANSPKLADLLLSLAQVRNQQREFELALAAAERADELVAGTDALLPHERAEILLAIAKALVGAKRDRARAEALAREALASLQSGRAVSRRRAAELAAWMRDAGWTVSEER